MARGAANGCGGAASDEFKPKGQQVADWKREYAGLQQQMQESPLEQVPQHLLAALLYQPALSLSCSEADLPDWFQEELRSMLA